MVYGSPFARAREPAVRPCGQCIDCRLNRSRIWAIRCMHEAQSNEHNCVVTLTYADEHLPANRSIVPDDAVDFMKRLRSRVDYDRREIYGPWKPIKTYGCAEYGEKFGRPHYHIILFNHAFKDAKPYGPTPGYYTSALLDEVWGKGRTQVMDLTFDSAAYVARYVMKKLSGKRAHEYGERLPERSVCVSKKGIAKYWYNQNKHKIFSNDLLYINGVKIKPIPYYNLKFELEHPNEYKKIKQKREQELQEHLAKLQTQFQKGDHTNNFTRRDRQRAHEQCMKAKLMLLKRTIE